MDKTKITMAAFTLIMSLSGCSAVSVQCNSNQATDRATSTTRNAGETNELGNSGKLQNNKLDNRI